MLDIKKEINFELVRKSMVEKYNSRLNYINKMEQKSSRF